eukprot:TRINITY_DN8197_c0_g5_i1.p2 TRINITY_DN8197_c0_g5~~TRINITY_DN8197_c0_g5_i1.p2  ORF type:complete len:135 (-),score=19.12 TRINITY_DN8197_c0_g5_i1:1419-1784(-)
MDNKDIHNSTHPTFQSQLDSVIADHEARRLHVREQLSKATDLAMEHSQDLDVKSQEEIRSVLDGLSRLNDEAEQQSSMLMQIRSYVSSHPAHMENAGEHNPSWDDISRTYERISGRGNETN